MSQLHRPRVCIATIDPHLGGGVLALSRFLYDYLEDADCVPYLLYLSLDRALRLTQPRQRPQLLEPVWTQAAGMRALTIGFIPQLEWFHYMLPALRLRPYLNNFEVFQVVGGTVHSGLPLVWNGKRFLCWLSTTWQSERISQLAGGVGAKLRAFSILNRPFDSYVHVLERRVLQSAVQVFATSEYTAQQICMEHGFQRERIEILPAPIDFGRLSPGGSSRSPIVLSVGRWTDPRKNLSLLLEAFALARMHLSDYRLVLVGTPPSQEWFDQQCYKLGIASTVEIKGHVPDDILIQYYQQAGMFVLPSLQEGLGIVLLEAMACRTPVISTRCGGPEEVIVDEQTGLLVPTGDAQALAQAIVRLATDEHLRQALGDRARQAVIERYSTERIGKRLLAAYREIYPHLFNHCDGRFSQGADN